MENCFEKFSQVFIRRFESLTSALAKLCSARIIVFNLVTPAYDYFSPASSQESHSLVNVTRTINCALTAYTKQMNSLSLFDIDVVYPLDSALQVHSTSECGITQRTPSLWSLYFEASKALSELIKSSYIPARKCIVLDLDNTLWGGILGEDGEENLKIGLTFPGVLYREFQFFLKGMRERGILLAINSKNNENDCLQFLRTSPEMFLKETDFSSCKINWKDKVSNMQEIAAELNLGLDSFVFIDDNPYECELVKSLLPQVMVYQMPTSPLEIPSFISELYGLKAIKVLDEDKKRSEYYLLDKQRKQFEQQCHSADEYFHKLHMKLTINTIMAADISRVAQLTQKTNQFNLTTRRYSESDIKKFMNERSRIYTLRMKDVFGEYGLVGVAILTNDQKDWIFDTLLFSCRVLGRSVEYAFVNFCIQEIKNIGGQFAIGEYIKTEKNEQVKDFYLRCNFKLLSESDPVTKYIFDPTNDALIETPDYFTIQIN